MSQIERRWWKEGVCYQVWPASFQDSNGDGFGDLPGLISRLDYLKSLGVDVIWLSPCYASPRHDMGYDISDYEDIDSDFGTLEDMDDLIKGVHDRGMKLLLDLVTNHTSDEHKWFQESKKSRDNEYSDYYIWRDPKIVDGQRVEPNNWASLFGGSAWKYVPERDQYYLHLFLESQPDTNWESRKVRRALYQTAIRFWLDRGIDGFRVDVVGLYSKAQDFPDAPVGDPHQKYHGPPLDKIVDGPRMHEFLQEQRREALEPYGDVILVGELGHPTTENLLRYLDPTYRELDMIFDMKVVAPDADMFTAGYVPSYDWSLPVIREGLRRPQAMISDHGRWSTVFLENHDSPRSISKFGSPDPALKFQSGKCLALLLCTLSGTLFIYQGQEIGMTNVPDDWPVSEMRDDWWIHKFREAMQSDVGDGKKIEEARLAFRYTGRDHSRTPMHWTGDKPSAGFSDTRPWIGMSETYAQGVSVADQQHVKDSLWTFWQEAVALRKSDPSVYAYGRTTFLNPDDTQVLYYTKTSDSDPETKVLVALNFSDSIQTLQWPSQIDQQRLGKMILSTHREGHDAQLAPREGRVYVAS